MRWFLLAALLVFPACKLHDSVQATVATTARIGKDIQTVTTQLAAVASDLAAMRAEADTDGDGKTSGKEWLNYLLLGGGGTGLISLLSRNRKSDQRKDKLDDRLAKLEAGSNAQG